MNEGTDCVGLVNTFFLSWACILCLHLVPVSTMQSCGFTDVWTLLSEALLAPYGRIGLTA